MSRAAAVVHGSVAPGFEPVAEAFERILVEAEEGGMAFAACAGGRSVVDLWGGSADNETDTPWGRETIQLVFSGTKGLVATCLLVLVDRGLLELEAPVSRYWPEFAAEGKGAITVAQVASHMAALPGLRGGFTPDDLLDGERMSDRTAAEAPFWEPGTQVAYHALTYGWLCDALVRRVDGRSVGVSSPTRSRGRSVSTSGSACRRSRRDGWRASSLPPTTGSRTSATSRSRCSRPSTAASFGRCRLERAGLPSRRDPGSERDRRRALDRPPLRAVSREGGELDGVRLLSEATVRRGREELSRGICAITRRPYAFGVGFELQTELMRFGPLPGAFGHTGSGGSTHGCWPDERVGFSFAMTELWPEARDDRGARLLAALADSLS